MASRNSVTGDQNGGMETKVPSGVQGQNPPKLKNNVWTSLVSFLCVSDVFCCDLCINHIVDWHFVGLREEVGSSVPLPTKDDPGLVLPREFTDFTDYLSVKWCTLFQKLRFNDISMAGHSRNFVRPCLAAIIQKIPGSGSRSKWCPKFHPFFFVYSYLSGNVVMTIRSAVFTWSC